MSHYTHLTIDEREKAMLFLSEGKSIRKIAKELNRSPSTLSRELKRNSKKNGEYSANYAHKQYHKRRIACHRPHIFENNEAVKYVCERLQLFWTPEQIAGRAKEIDKFHISFSYNTIYRAIKLNLIPKSLKVCLPYGRKYKNHKPNGRKSKFSDCLSISERPDIINNRLEFGHWEFDSVLGIRKTTNRLATFLERVSGYYMAVLVEDASSETYIKRAIEYFTNNLPVEAYKSFTIDRGSEFTQYKTFEEKLHIPVYVCDPYSPWQRGANENANGLLRFFFPKKKTSFDDVSPDYLAFVIDLINNRPRKRLNWKSPKEVFFDSF